MKTVVLAGAAAPLEPTFHPAIRTWLPPTGLHPGKQLPILLGHDQPPTVVLEEPELLVADVREFFRGRH